MTKRRASIKDVAARAGVSWKTVSNVVNDRPVVRPATRERVEAAIAELGYVPNRVGRDLRGGPTRTIALVLPELENPYFARLAQRFQHAARRRGYEVSVELSLGDRAAELDHLADRRLRPVDAVIMSPARLTAADVAARTSRTPLVLIGETVPAAGGAVHVAIDNAASAVDVVRHLVDGGRRRLLFLGAESGARSTGTDRLAGFRAAVRFAGLPEESELIRSVPVWDRPGGAAVVRDALAEGIAFDAIVAANDLMAIGALSALRQAEIDLPGAVAVVGWDDIPEAAFSVPALSSVAPDLDTLVGAALDAALADVTDDEGATGARDVVVPHELRVRESSVGG